MSIRTPRERARKAWKSWATEVGLAVVVLAGFHFWQTRHAVSGAAPALDALSLDGERVSLQSLAAKGPVLVDFWATWCSVCKAEEGNIAAVAKDHQVVAVATNSGNTVRAYAQAHHMTMPVVEDPGGALARAWGVNAFPTSFIIGRDGRVRFVEVGYTTEIGLLARLWWAGR